MLGLSMYLKNVYVFVWCVLMFSTLDPPALPHIFPRIDDNNCNRLHSSVTAIHCFDDGFVGKQSLALEEYFAEYWLKEVHESMDRYSACHDITEILLKMALNTTQSTFDLWSTQSVFVWGGGLHKRITYVGLFSPSY